MTEFAAFDLDRGTARAWSRFQARLADHLADMRGDDTLVIEAQVADEDVAGATPYVQFAGLGGGTMLRGEVSSNGYLDDRYRLTDTQCAQLEALGWRAPTVAPTVTPAKDEEHGSANFFVDLSRREADRLAVMSVTVLREVLGVPHPVFVAADELGHDPEPHAGAAAEGGTVPGAVDDEPLATMVESDDHLRALVDAALFPLFGSTPEKDEDGDIPVPCGSSLVFVRVEQDVPIVRLFSVVVEGVTDMQRAAFEVNVLNRDVRFLKFVLAGDRVLAHAQLPAWPFVPEHLRTMLTGMSQRIDDVDDDLVARVGGRRAFEPDDTPGAETVARPAQQRSEPAAEQPARGALDIELLTLLQLDADAPGTVDPTLAAGVCRGDQELVVRLIQETEKQEVAWHISRDRALLDGDTEEARACDQEMQAWERTTALLRRTLRLVVERALGRTDAAPSSSPGRKDE
jgi:hypothetical protein